MKIGMRGRRRHVHLEAHERHWWRRPLQVVVVALAGLGLLTVFGIIANAREPYGGAMYV